jgi:hypothetical protein
MKHFFKTMVRKRPRIRSCETNITLRLNLGADKNRHGYRRALDRSKRGSPSPSLPRLHRQCKSSREVFPTAPIATSLLSTRTLETIRPLRGDRSPPVSLYSRMAHLQRDRSSVNRSSYSSIPATPLRRCDQKACSSKLFVHDMARQCPALSKAKLREVWVSTKAP